MSSLEYKIHGIKASITDYEKAIIDLKKELQELTKLAKCDECKKYFYVKNMDCREGFFRNKFYCFDCMGDIDTKEKMKKISG